MTIRIDAGNDVRLIALARVLEVLAPYADFHVMAGGWVPYFLLSAHGTKGWTHTGSADLDFFFDARRMTPEVRADILTALKAIGAKPRKAPGGKFVIEYSYLVPVETRGRTASVQVDLMGIDLQPGDLDDWRSRTQLALRNCVAAEIVSSDKLLPLRITNAAALLCMKAIAMTERSKPKDSYDLYTLLRYYRGGPTEIARELRPILDAGPPAKKAMISLRKRFRNATSEGPLQVVEFLAADAPLENQLALRAEVSALFGELFSALGDDDAA